MNKFLGKDGLTLTSANHIANIAKEMYESLETKMKSLCLVSRDFTLAINGQTYRIENESTKDEFDMLSTSLKDVAALKSLIAWLREGIKAKVKETSEEKEEEWIKEQIKAGRTELEEPIKLEKLLFEDILMEEPIDKQVRYYTLEAKCATFGKFIHPDGHFAEARKTFFNKQKNPTSIEGRGQEVEINTYTTMFTTEEVDKKFFALQQEYRSVQAEFNSIKSEIERKLSAKTQDLFNEYIAKWKECSTNKNLALIKRREEINCLKIVIPESLKEIYNKVATIASAK